LILILILQSAILPPVYAIGPLPLLLSGAGGGDLAIDDDASAGSSASSLSKENRACLDWLDGKHPNSVVFASFGSLVKLTHQQLVELAWGLANSGYEFLWVIRSDQQQQLLLANGGTATAAVLPPEFLAETTEGRCCVTSW